MLEEMLPQCEVVGIRYEDELALPPEPDAHHGQLEESRGAACVRKTGEIPT